MVSDRTDKVTASHRWLKIGLALVFFAAGMRIALGSEYGVLNWFLSDDAFYYYKIAQNIVEGRGSTFDGVNPTNGYHPLWLIICVPIFALARYDLVLPLRIVILVSTALGAASVPVSYTHLTLPTNREV